MALRNPSTGPRIVPFGQERNAQDVLPNGRPAFRVTQRFADTDRYFGGIHGALDLGNYYCGDAMLASLAGRVRNRRDVYGALIVEVVKDDGAAVGYGHLQSFARADGSSVDRGTTIGYVGDTGLGGICHCHFYYRDPSGKLRDPWPLLDQNQVSTVYCKFNAGVDGVNIRRAPDARQNNVYAVAYRDPRGIVRLSDGARLGSTGARRIRKAVVTGPDGQVYWKINLGGGTYVNAQFMHRV